MNFKHPWIILVGDCKKRWKFAFKYWRKVFALSVQTSWWRGLNLGPGFHSQESGLSQNLSQAWWKEWSKLSLILWSVKLSWVPLRWWPRMWLVWTESWKIERLNSHSKITFAQILKCDQNNRERKWYMSLFSVIEHLVTGGCSIFSRPRPNLFNSETGDWEKAKQKLNVLFDAANLRDTCTNQEPTEMCTGIFKLNWTVSST